MEGKEEGRRLTPSKGKKVALIVVLAVIAALLLGYLGLCAYASGDRLLPRWHIVGVDVGGMRYADAVQKVKDATAELYRDFEIPIEVGEKTVTLSARDAGVEADAEFSVKAALTSKGSFLTSGAKFIQALFREVNGGCLVNVTNESYIRQVLDEVAASVERPVVETSWEVREENSTLIITHGVTGQTVDVDGENGVYQRVKEALMMRKDEPIQAQLITTPPAEPDFAQMARDVAREPVDATLDHETGDIVDHKVGLALDEAAARSVYEETGEGESRSVALTVSQPEITAQELKAVLFRDVLGEAESRISGGANRLTNVTLASQACDGVILLPGEEMSYNGTTGQRTSAKGYKKASGYTAAGEVDMVGGGVCQPSSTLYLACLRADLEIVDRKNHMYTVSYMPEGMDATVNWPNLDYVFANSTSYPLKVTMTIENRTLKVKLLGTKTDDAYVEMESVRLETYPSATVYKADATVPQGSTKVVQTAHTGKKVAVYKNRYAGDGSLISRDLVSTDTYRKTDKVIAYNPIDGAPGIDPVIPDTTGWATDPATGWPIDPNTGKPVDPAVLTTPAPSTPPAPSDPAVPTPPTSETPAPPATPPVDTPPVTPPPPSETPAAVTPPPAEPPAVTPPAVTPPTQATPTPDPAVMTPTPAAVPPVQEPNQPPEGVPAG